jgi:hypothetical protein
MSFVFPLSCPITCMAIWVIMRRGGVTPPTRIMDKPDLIDIGDDTIVPFSTNSDNPLMQSHMNDEKSRNINEKGDMETGDLYDCLTNEGTEIEIKGETSTREGGATTPLQMAPTLGQIIGGFKYLASKTINEMDGTPGRKILQRGFHDHIIRNENELKRIRKYIVDNPKNWKDDEDNPENSKNETESYQTNPPPFNLLSTDCACYHQVKVCDCRD